MTYKYGPEDRVVQHDGMLAVNPQEGGGSKEMVVPGVGGGREWQRKERAHSDRGMQDQIEFSSPELSVPNGADGSGTRGARFESHLDSTETLIPSKSNNSTIQAHDGHAFSLLWARYSTI